MINSQSALELEELVYGKCNSIELKMGITREEIVEEINHIVHLQNPGSKLHGHFINPEQTDYMVYDLMISDIKKQNSSIRLLDFGDRMMVVRV